MFTPTKSLGSLKGVFPSIHQPLPLTRHESQKLLNTLKTSFRSRLDKEYGWESEEQSRTASLSKRPATSPPSTPENATQHQHQHQHQHRPTDRHLHSILSNPLFKQAKPTTEKVDTTKSTRDPMVVFDEASSKGLMTRKAATGCLVAKRREILQSSNPSIYNAMAESGAARRVVQWLQSSGEERNGAFLADDRFMKELVGFMVAEGLEEVVWQWADRLALEEAANQLIPDAPQGVFLGRLLSRLVDAKAQVVDDKSLDGAYAAILRADRTWRASSNLSRILQQPWRHLSWSSTVEAWNRPRPSNKLFDDYVRISEHLRAPVRLDLAHLDLHHPTKPSHKKALEYFTREKLEVSLDSSSGKQEARVQRFVNRVASMGMDTVKHLTQIGRTDDAEWVLKLLRTRLSDNSSGHGTIPVL